MTKNTEQPEALRLADIVERLNVGVHSQAIAEEYSAAAAELRRLHERDMRADVQIKELLQVIEDLERGSEMLSQRVQELGETARENRSKRVIELEQRIAELEEQMDAIGAGGVEPLRKTSADTSALRAALEEAEAAVPEDALDADRWMGICKAIFGDEDHVLVPRGLIGAACYAIDKKRDGTKTLAELRRYTTGDLSAATQPAAQGIDAPWSDLKVAFDCDDTDVLWAALDAGSLIFPKGWELVETDGSCARSVTIFRVDHAPVTAEGIAVKAVIDAAIAAQAKQGGAAS